MPTNLKNLLSRSRSRTELKVPPSSREAEVPGTICSCSSDSPEGVTCQCQDNTLGSRVKLQRGTSSRSLFSLPVEGLVISRPNSPDLSPDDPNGGGYGGGEREGIQVTSHNVMRKCETVLALSSFDSGVDGGGSSNLTSGSSPTRVKVMKDRILSTSSSALTNLLQTTSNKSSKLFGWKFGTSKAPTPSQHHHSHQLNQGPLPLFPPLHNGGNLNGPLLETSRSQVSVYDSRGTAPLTPTNRLRRHGSVTNTPFWFNEISRHSSCSSVLGWNNALADDQTKGHGVISCRLCLCDVSLEDTVKILNCSCRYCKDCVTAYVSFEVEEGAYDIACPDAACEQQGVLTLVEIEAIVPNHIVEKHKKFRLYKDVETDCELMWCPTPGCETICKRKDSTVNGAPPSTIPIIQCTRCQHVYCTECRLPIHSDLSCESYRHKLIRQGKLSLLDDEPFAACESIKKCPFCHVPIEKDSGCAQMMCKRCKHVFCWYCLSSLDDDFLLRHYDKGPCKNKLGHSRASVVWHRTQVIGIFAGFGLLVLLASPLLILAAPCLLCCRCRYCSSHLDPPDDSPVSI